jgi:hypothetical protein
MPKKKKGARRDATTQGAATQGAAAPVTEWDAWERDIGGNFSTTKERKRWEGASARVKKTQAFKTAETLEEKKQVFITKMNVEGLGVSLAGWPNLLAASPAPEPQVAPKMPSPLGVSDLTAVRKYFSVTLGWAQDVSLMKGDLGGIQARQTEHLIWESAYFKTYKESGMWEEPWRQKIALREEENLRRRGRGEDLLPVLPASHPTELYINRDATKCRNVDTGAEGWADAAAPPHHADGRESYYLSNMIDLLYKCFLNNLYGYSDYGDLWRYKCWFVKWPNDMSALFGCGEQSEKITWYNYLKLMVSSVIEDKEGNRICSISAFVYDILYTMVDLGQLIIRDLPPPHCDPPSQTQTAIACNYLRMIINEATVTGKMPVDKTTFITAARKMLDEAAQYADTALHETRHPVLTRKDMRSMDLKALMEHADIWLSPDTGLQQKLEAKVAGAKSSDDKKAVVIGWVVKNQPEEPHIIQMMMVYELVHITVKSKMEEPEPGANLQMLKDAYGGTRKAADPMWGPWFDDKKNIYLATEKLKSTLTNYLFPEVVEAKTPEEEEAERAREADADAAAEALIREEERRMERDRERERESGRERETKKGRGRGRGRGRERERERERAEPKPEPDDDEDGGEGDEREDGDEDEGEIHSDEVLSEMIRPVYDKCSDLNVGGGFKEMCGGKDIEFEEIAGISIQIYHFLKHKTIKFIVGKLSVYFDLDDPRTFWIALIMFCLIYFANRLDFDSDFMVKGGISLILNTHRERSSTSDNVKIPINDIDISIKPDKNELPVILFKLASVILCSGVLLLNRGNTFNRCESDTTRRTSLQELSGSEFESVVHRFADRRQDKFSFEYLVDKYPLPDNLKEFIIETEENEKNESIENLRKYIDLNYTEWHDSDGEYIKILQIGNKGTQGDGKRAAYDASYICDLVIEEQPFREAHLMSGGDDSEGNPLPADMEGWSSFSETFFRASHRPISYFIYRSLDGNIDSYKKMAEDCLSLGLELIKLPPDRTFISQLRGNFSNKNGKLEKFRERLFIFGQTLSGDNVPDKILRLEAELFARYHEQLSEAVDYMISAGHPVYDKLSQLSDTKAYIDVDSGRQDIGLREGLNKVLRAKMRFAFAKRGGGNPYKRSKYKRYKRNKTKKKKTRKTKKKKKRTKRKSINII